MEDLSIPAVSYYVIDPRALPPCLGLLCETWTVAQMLTDQLSSMGLLFFLLLSSGCGTESIIFCRRGVKDIIKCQIYFPIWQAI